MDDIHTAMQISAAGMRAQSARLRIVSENIANANSTAEAPGVDPYRRQVPVFSSYVDKAMGADLVRVDRVALDPSEFTLRFDPAHPAANPEGYVMLPNVNPLVEMMDMREAQRSYEANLGALDTMRSMAASTLRILE
ncbi:MAG: flagellar basal body rod protein FlgC [Marinicaulis sp.]|nr:flagellar basal body rod protein FlgC [Marinicaulis sp.]NNE41209.1 flagellar basal body rod protein FlgC [Marinicaulis sp.]NNL88363.1 flagellar basal body rod protein FlgC [Marinicaulis sp.]